MPLRNLDNARSILVVEDDRISLKAMVALLGAEGYAPIAADSAEGALRMINAGSKPQMAVVDLDLPGINGWELIRRLRKSNRHLASVLVTANSKEDIKNMLGEDPVPYLRKPVDFPQLMILLSEQQANPA